MVINFTYFETFPWAILTSEVNLKFERHPYGEGICHLLSTYLMPAATLCIHSL